MTPGRIGFAAVETEGGITVFELMGGYEIEKGDIISGDLESLGGEIVTSRKKLNIIAATLLFIVVMGYNSIYEVEDNEQIIITRFGKIREGPITKPGFHFKFFNLDTVVRYPTSELLTKVQLGGCSTQLPITGITLNYIISDPIVFYKRFLVPDRVAGYVSREITDKYCQKSVNEHTDFVTIDISNFVKEKLANNGIFVVRITFDDYK